MLKIGLTGGIGSGKSTVAAIFETQGIPVIDADKISHNLVLPGQPCLKKIIRCFGRDLLQADGNLDRAKLRNEVFNNPDSKKQLETIMHPVVIKEMEDQADAAIAPYCILAIPLLVETQLQHSVDRILVVDLPEDLQLKRVQERSKLSPDEIKAIMNTQSAREVRRTHAHDIINNSGEISLLNQQVQKLHTFYLGLSRKIDG